MDKKIFIIDFSTPILRDVALKLKEQGANILFWQGYRDYFRFICKDTNNFPNTIFHNSNDALKAIPPKDIDMKNFDPPAKETIEKMSPYFSHVMFLIERDDFNGFSLSQKRHLYYEYIKFWQGMIRKFNPDAILFADVPHDGNMYVLYALAKVFKIKIIITEQIAVESRTLLINDYETSSIAVKDYYESNQDKQYQLEDLSPDLQGYYTKQTNTSIDATPEYQQRALKRPVPFRTPTWRAIIRNIVKLRFFKITFSYLRMLWMKSEEQNLGDPMRGFQYKLIINKWIKKNRALKKEYECLQEQVDFSEKFIYLPLGFQPERTTCPQAGVYDDQLLMIDTLARCLPQGWKLYVKENPNQLQGANIFSHMYRYKGYYKHIASLKNVRLVPVNTSTYDLIKHAQAVAVGTGSAGWEALLRSKPAMVFGSVWYMYCGGALRVDDAISCRQALSAIVDGFKPDKQKVLNYLVALDRNSVRARHFRTLVYRESDYKKNDYISHEDNVKNLSLALSKAILC